MTSLPVEYSTLLCVLTASPDAEGCLDEMNRLLHQVADHAREIETRRVVAIGRIEKALLKPKPENCQDGGQY
jgi:non-ribosomal peptide synthetase component F